MRKITIFLTALIIVSVLTAAYAADYKYEGIKPAKVLESPSSFPAGLEWDGSSFWMIDREKAKLLRIDPATMKIKESFVTPGYKPSGLAWDGEQLWITDLESGKIYRLDPKTKVVTRVIDCPVSAPYGITWDGKLLWLLDASRAKSTISSIDPMDGTTITSFKAPNASGTGLVFDGKYLWSADRRKDELYMISPEHGNVINVLHAPGPFAYGLAWDGKYLWNVDYETDKLYALDVRNSGKYYTWGAKKERVTFTTSIDNLGKGDVKSFDMYYAVPTENAAQDILTRIKWYPKPQEYIKDKWGQRIARFKFEDIKPGESERVKMTVEVKTSAIRYIIFPDRVTNEIPEEISSKYLADDLKYDINNPYIQKLAKKIVGDEKNMYWQARKIFDYLIANMYYELSGGWNTAPTVLKRGNGSCSEYSFSYISLCRAIGIPARYVGTLVIRYDDASWDEVYHRWAQIYLPGYGWINVDGNRGDKDWPSDQAVAFGGYGNSFLMTTQGGGGSEYLRFNYNYDYSYTATGRVNVRVNQVAEWEPID